MIKLKRNRNPYSFNPGEPDSNHDDEDYVMASGRGWNDHTATWRFIDTQVGAIEPSGFLCEASRSKHVRMQRIVVNPVVYHQMQVIMYQI